MIKIQKKDKKGRKGKGRSVYFEWDILKKLDALCQKTNRSSSEIVNLILEDYFKKEKA